MGTTREPELRQKNPATTGPAQEMKNEFLEKNQSLVTKRDLRVTTLWRNVGFMDEIVRSSTRLTLPGWIYPGVLVALLLGLCLGGCASAGCRCEVKKETPQEVPDKDAPVRVRIVLPASS